MKHSSNHQKAIKNSQFGTCWIYDPKEDKNLKIKKDDLELYLNQGFLKGRLKNKPNPPKSIEQSKKGGLNRWKNYPKISTIQINCLNCEKQMSIPSNKTQKYCCKQCYWEHGNFYRKNSTKYTNHQYKNENFNSKSELEFFQFLETNNIKIKRNYKRFPYTFNNKKHWYIPDFYLPEYQIYVEIKGKIYYDDLVPQKLIQFPENIVFIFSNNFNLELNSFLKNLNGGLYET